MFALLLVCSFLFQFLKSEILGFSSLTLTLHILFISKSCELFHILIQNLTRYMDTSLGHAIVIHPLDFCSDLQTSFLVSCPPPCIPRCIVDIAARVMLSNLGCSLVLSFLLVQTSAVVSHCPHHTPRKASTLNSGLQDSAESGGSSHVTDPSPVLHMLSSCLKDPPQVTPRLAPFFIVLSLSSRLSRPPWLASMPPPSLPLPHCFPP